MSLEVLLIPIAIAGIAAIKEARSTDLCEKCKATRISDQQSLVRALERLGASNITEVEGRVTCNTSFGELTFQKVNNVFLGRINGASDDDNLLMLSELDKEFGAVVQLDTAENAKAYAKENGLKVVSEQWVDGNLQLLFEEA